MCCINHNCVIEEVDNSRAHSLVSRFISGGELLPCISKSSDLKHGMNFKSHIVLHEVITTSQERKEFGHPIMLPRRLLLLAVL
jgi:hypothetical protein